MRLRVFKKVDLPQPEGPMSAVISRSPTSSEMPFSALKSPYQRFRSFADITGTFVFSIEYLIVEFQQEVYRFDPSREKVDLKNPQIFQIYEIKNNFPLFMARANAEAILNSKIKFYCFCFSLVFASRAARLMASTSTSSTAPMPHAESKSPSSKARRYSSTDRVAPLEV